MGGYIANFTVYTLAMTGLICFAVFIYKKVMDGTMRSSNTKFLSVEESMSLSPRKTLHVVRAGNEKFLIASDIDRTTLISKLGTKNQQPISQQIIDRYESLDETEDMPQAFNNYYPSQQTKPQQVQQKTQQTVHLEPIRTPKQKTQMDRRIQNNIQQNQNPKTVTLDFANQNSHKFSTMKEMAKKINEL